MKGLFVTFNGITDEAFGGAKASIRNYQALRQITTQLDIITIKKRSNWMSVLSGIQGNFPPVLNADCEEILLKVEQEKYNFVFFDGSAFGKIVEKVKSKGIETIVFFHNCESDYNRVRFGNHKSIKSFVYQKLVNKNEKISAENGSKLVVFTTRDRDRIQKLYNVRVSSVIPVGMQDIFDGINAIGGQNYCLLLGPAQAANIEGFGWFISNVSPKLNCKTVIVGKGFEAYRKAWNSDKVEVVGFVEDIRPYYKNAKCVAIPLFSGGGMKLKTVEALMFGKYIFGTDEAFVGFDFDDKKIGGRCNTKEEYIAAINRFLDRSQKTFNDYARALYVNNYSIEASMQAFENLLR